MRLLLEGTSEEKGGADRKVPDVRQASPTYLYAEHSTE